MKNILKISILVVVSTIILWILSHNHLIHFDLIKNALTNHIWLICFVALLQIFNHIAMGLRYHCILKILHLAHSIKQALATTFVGNGIGQWLPGSLAFIEVIRVSLLTKTTDKHGAITESKTSHLAIASLFDRLIGLFVGLFIGTFVTIYFIFSLKNLSSTNSFILYMILLFNSFSCVLILMFPFFAGSKLMQRFLARMELTCLKFVSHSALQHFTIKLFHKINGLIKIFSTHGKNYKVFFIPIGLSVCSLLGFALSLEIASYALGTPLPFLVTFAVISMLSIITALPISIGGIGAPQLITAVLFGAFGVNSADAASAQLLQTGITLLTITLCALIYLPRIIKEIIKPRMA